MLSTARRGATGITSRPGRKVTSKVSDADQLMLSGIRNILLLMEARDVQDRP